MARMRKVREFKTEQEERQFWETHDSSGYVDWAEAESVSLLNLKLSPKLLVEDNEENQK